MVEREGAVRAPGARIRILVVDDSSITRTVWSRILNAETDLVVTGSAASADEALAQVRRADFDVVLLDVEMPGMSGIEAIPLLLAARPGLRIIIASALTTHGSKAAIDALTVGALDYVAKPSTQVPGGSMQDVGRELVGKIRAVTREKEGIAPTRVAPRTDRGTAPVVVPRVIAIGSSTGGPNALVAILKDCEKTVTQPILIVQHMPAYFISALAERLSRESGRPCLEAAAGTMLQPGSIYLAPGDFHMRVGREGERLVLEIDKGEPENFCRPAVDPLFRSLASACGREVLAIVLTGMGEDGRRGCESLRKAGAMVVAQDEATSVVWGMPGAVARAGLADAILPLEQIAGYVERACAGGKGRA